MNDISKMDFQSTPEEINKLLFDYYMHLSSEAAFKGDYITASSYISGLSKSFGDNLALMDLQAKIYAQQGMFNEASFLWRKCLKADPNNNHFISALHRIDQLQKSRVFYRFFRFKGVVLTLSLIAIGLLLYTVVAGINRQSANMKLLQEQQITLLAKIDALPAIREIRSSTNILNEVKTNLAKVAGINVVENNGTLLVTFNEGLFRKGAKPLKTGIETIALLAKMLDPFAGRILMSILGCSDDVQIVQGQYFNDDNSLRQARAMAVGKIILKNSRILNEDILTGILSVDKVPFINDNHQNQQKNRTVAIKIGIK